MTLKTKTLLLAILPLLAASGAITFITLNQAAQLSEEEIHTFEQSFLSSKKRELQHYVSLALTSIGHILESSDSLSPQDEEDIKSILHGLTYGSDGYFFVYDPEGVNLVHPIQPELVGRNLHDLRDANGNYVIQNLLRLSREGGGFHRYLWNKPSKGEVEDKLSYVVALPKLQWMMGTGLYLDDINRDIANIRQQVKSNIQNTFYAVVFIIFVTIVFIMALGIVINVHEHHMADTRLRKLAHRSVRFQINERRRYARELHDGINQLLVAAKFRIGTAMKRLAGDDQKTLAELTQAELSLTEAMEDVRRISHDLRPSVLDDLGFVPALKSLLSAFSERNQISVEMDFQHGEQALGEDVEITFYRITQEALTNIEKHARADSVVLRTQIRDDRVSMELSDDGCGFHLLNPPDRNGIGLQNMRERLELLSGSLQIQTQPAGGTRLIATLPLRPDTLWQSSGEVDD